MDFPSSSGLDPRSTHCMSELDLWDDLHRGTDDEINQFEESYQVSDGRNTCDYKDAGSLIDNFIQSCENDNFTTVLLRATFVSDDDDGKRI